MSGARHARRSRVPFVVVLAVLLTTVAAVAWALVDGRGGATRGAIAEVAGDSPTPTTPGSTDDAGGTSHGGTAAATTPSETTRTQPAKRDLVIHATGDVSLDPGYIPAFVTNGYDWAWTGLGGLFRRDDLTLINHECPSTEIVAPIPKTFSFRCDPAALPVARRYGVDVASLANNHGFDQGPEGLLDSLRNLREAGIVPIGAGRDERAADAPRYVRVGGWRIGLVGIDEVLDPDYEVAVGDRPGTAVGHDFPRALRAIREADANADLVLVMIHWGVELDTEPRAYQVEEAERMIDAGADAIFGSHAHRLQPMATYHGRPIFYGLGNFVWPNFSAAGSTTAVAEVTVTAEGRIEGRLLPAVIVSPGHPELR
jgi:poly-gamma-glutamate synthesis protein (capsule biosynthesis protein)